MIPRNELLLIALAHAESGASFVFDDRGIPAFQYKGRKCMIGLFIPASTYFCSPNIEQMTTYEMRDAGIFSEGDLDFAKEMDKVNILDDEEWETEIRKKIDGSESSN